MKGEKKVKNIKMKIAVIAIICMMAIVMTPVFIFGELKNDSLTLTVGDNAKIELTNPILQQVAQYEVADGNIIATGQGGEVEAYEPGEAQVEVKIPFRTLVCDVSVLGFEESELTMLTGQTMEPGIGGASDEAEFYSSDREVVDIVDGELVALKDGTADIICNDNGVQVSQSVYVAGINSDRSYVFAGNKMQLSTNESLIGKPTGWISSDPLVAEVDETGAVTGVSAGSAEVSCRTQNGETIKTTVNVVGMKEEEMYLQPGDVYTTPLISGEGFDTEGIEWKSGDKAVARVDEGGNIKAVGGGETEVSCSIDGQRLGGKVHVMSLPEKAYTAVGMDSKLQLSNAGSNDVVWKSSDESKVTVKDGVLKGVGTGTATITATAKNKTLSCNVSVVKLSNASLKMKEEEKKTIEIAGLDDQQATWASADTNVAVVNQLGEITPVSEGKTTVYCSIGPSTMTIPVTIQEKDLKEQQVQQAEGTKAQPEGEPVQIAEAPEPDNTEANAARPAQNEEEDTEKKEEKSQESTKKSSDSKKETEKKNEAAKKKETSSAEAKTPEKVVNTSGQLTGPEAMIACGNYYNSVLEKAVKNGEKWVYSNSSKYVAQSGTFEKMLAGKVRGGNCASIANWAFRDMGIISNSQKFYGDGSGKIRNYNSGSTKLKATLDKNCTIINGKSKSFGTLMKEGKIEVGDVIIGKGHTYVYRGNGTVFASGHDAKWHKDKSAKTEDSNKAVFESWVRKYKGTYDERFKVHYIIRIKDSFVPKYYRDEDGNLVKNR